MTVRARGFQTSGHHVTIVHGGTGGDAIPVRLARSERADAMIIFDLVHKGGVQFRWGRAD
jgi:hypothetical protein